ncbi:NSFL1 cofactor p47-like isoform X2 [Brevipalpus obovatus]|uniref:NSFL1 cofactor p47-like isoform X2 n=1 Tax=Brevipalpus obovatus TaxID=246614 RepID=UPI003D9EE58F
MEGKGKGLKKSNTGKANIATLGSLNQPHQDSSSDEDGQAFFVGGSDRSGQQVLGPSKDKRNNEEVIDHVFKAAREQGAEVVDPEPQSSRKKIDPFKGRGMKLTDEGQSGPSGSESPELESEEPVPMRLKMWRNGFSVDDGPLRSFEDPENREFLASISRGEVPRELVREAKGREVALNMEDHRTEEYVPVKKPIKAFSGAGQRLGAVTPETISSSEGLGQGDLKKNEENAKKKLATDEAKPVTNIQIRLSDGSRLTYYQGQSHSYHSRSTQLYL